MLSSLREAISGEEVYGLSLVSGGSSLEKAFPSGVLLSICPLLFICPRSTALDCIEGSELSKNFEPFI
jgi:hypothetical protein